MWGSSLKFRHGECGFSKTSICFRVYSSSRYVRATCLPEIVVLGGTSDDVTACDNCLPGV